MKAAVEPTTRWPSMRMLGVAFGVGDDQDPLAEVDGLVELHAQEIEAGQTAQRRVVLSEVLAALEQLERLRVGLGDFRRIPLCRHQRPREGHAQRDLLADGLGRRRRLGQDREHARGEGDRVLVPAARLVEDEQAVGQLRQPREIGGRDPVAPGDAQVLDLDGHGRHGLIAASDRSVLAGGGRRGRRSRSRGPPA